MTTFVRRCATLACAGVLLGPVACGVSKVAQCNKLIEKANAAMQVATDAQKKLDGKDDSKDVADMASQLDKAKADIASVQLSDDKLKGLQGDYVKTIDRMVTAARAMQTAADSKNADGITAALNDLNAAETDNGKVVDSINQYCSGG